MSKVKHYYDEMAEHYQQKGSNDRNYKIQALLHRFGLKKQHSVLEIGCGTGVQTNLLAKVCRKVIGIDISIRSIELAKKQFSIHKNITFLAADILHWDFSESFDVIVLPDVLHYIPEEKHGELFRKMKNWLLPNGFILIHSPSAEFIDWCRENDTSKLNIDDIALDNQRIMQHCTDNNLKIQALEQYALWHLGGDFQYIVVRLKDSTNFDIRGLSFWAKAKKHFTNYMRRLT